MNVQSLLATASSHFAACVPVLLLLCNRLSFMVAWLVRLAGDVVLRVPVGIAAVYGMLTNVVAELVVW